MTKMFLSRQEADGGESHDRSDGRRKERAIRKTGQGAIVVWTNLATQEKPCSNTSTYANPELRNFQISSTRPSRGKIGDEIEVVDLSRQINLAVDSDDVQELPDFHNQELTTDELIEMQEQDIEELESLDPVRQKIE
ncbi:hypothetical protein TNCV_5041411 [Trichonephila clavipes]|nr:hypothetical protein TNCV_5041411 [Trichonephila clavipes]